MGKWLAHSIVNKQTKQNKTTNLYTQLLYVGQFQARCLFLQILLKQRGSELSWTHCLVYISTCWIFCSVLLVTNTWFFSCYLAERSTILAPYNCAICRDQYNKSITNKFVLLTLIYGRIVAKTYTHPLSR